MTNARSTTLTFCLLLGGLITANLLTPDRAFSENENRYLKQRPALTLSAVAEGRYMEEFDLYVTDQFTLRDSWVGVKTLSERTIGRRSSGGIYFARDQYLIEMFDAVDLALYQKNLGYLRQFSDTAQRELEIPVQVMLVPAAGLAHSDRLPGNAPEISQRTLLQMAEEALPGLVDVSDALSAHADEYIYYRTDHHWTSLGAFHAYNSLREQLGLSPRELEEYGQELLSDRFYGTNYSKASLYTTPPDDLIAFYPRSNPQITVEYGDGTQMSDSIYEYSYLDTKDKYAVFLNANQPLVRIRTQADNGRRLLVVKDSYFNVFAQMLLEDFQEIVVLDLRYFKAPVADFAAANSTTDILVLYSLKGFASDVNLFYLSR